MSTRGKLPMWLGRSLFLAVLLAVTLIGLKARVGADEKGTALVPASLKTHPRVFSMIVGWLSDGESPVVTEINLDAVAASRNQFDPDAVKTEDGWIRCAGADGNGFVRYRVTAVKGRQITVDYQENGGGSLTTAAKIEAVLEKREVRVDGKAAMVNILRVLSCQTK